MFRLFQIGDKILIALSFNQLYISLKFHLFTLMFFAKHSIIKRLTNIDLYYNTFRVRGIQVSELQTDSRSQLTLIRKSIEVTSNGIK